MNMSYPLLTRKNGERERERERTERDASGGNVGTVLAAEAA